VGVDLSRKMLELCKRRRLPSVNLILADCHNLPFRDFVFDAIMSSRVLIYLNLEIALNEAKRALRDNGSLMLLVQIENRPMILKLRERLGKSEPAKFLENANYLTAHELITRVSKHFKVTKTIGVIFRENISERAVNSRPIAFLLNRLYLRLLYALEKQFSASFLKYFYASSIVIKARKT
jgi:ubiquinone/menaquinone biosynthesis C-methylase UbiE